VLDARCGERLGFAFTAETPTVQQLLLDLSGRSGNTEVSVRTCSSEVDRLDLWEVHGVVWCGVVWCGVGWGGVVWVRVLWHGTGCWVVVWCVE